MTIYGVSQTSGVERRLEVAGAGEGVSLGIYDHAGGEERDRIVVPAADLMTAVTERPEAGSTIEGEAAGARRRLDIQVRYNEVQLRTHGEGQSEWDVAVGLDDFQDALEVAVGAG